MSELKVGDLVVLTCGSMRMAVEAIGEDGVACVWCHEGEIGRDVFAPVLLKKWEFREDQQRGDRDQRGGGRPYGGDREGGGKRYGGDKGGRSGDRGDRGDRSDRGERDDRPRGKTGWDGKPREKKYYRKDD